MNPFEDRILAPQCHFDVFRCGGFGIAAIGLRQGAQVHRIRSQDRFAIKAKQFFGLFVGIDEFAGFGFQQHDRFGGVAKQRLEPRFAFFQRLLVLLVRCDVPGDRIQAILTGQRRGAIPFQPAVGAILAAITIFKLNNVNSLGQRFQNAPRRFHVVGMNPVNKRSRQQLFFRVTQRPGEHRVDAQKVTIRSSDTLEIQRVSEDAVPFSQDLSLTSLSLGQSLLQFRSGKELEIRLNHLGKFPQQFDLLVRKVSGLAVDQAKCTDAIAALDRQRVTGIKPDVRRSGHQRIVVKTNVLQGVVHNQGFVRRDRMTAKRNVPPRLRYIQPHTGLEPLPVRVDQADQRNRHPEDFAGHPGQSIQMFVRGRVEHVELLKCPDPLLFVRDDGSGQHDSPVAQRPV